MKQEYIKLTKEQKGRCKRIVIYADEFENNVRDEIWESYCDILGISSDVECIKLYVFGEDSGTINEV